MALRGYEVDLIAVGEVTNIRAIIAVALKQQLAAIGPVATEIVGHEYIRIPTHCAREVVKTPGAAVVIGQKVEIRIGSGRSVRECRLGTRPTGNVARIRRHAVAGEII